MPTQPKIFKWRQTEPALILCAVRWYLRYCLSLRDVEELLEERGLEADHTTVWRWVQRYGPELEQRLRRHLKPTNKSWRVDETYLRVKGRWCYLYRAIDSAGATIDFLLSALRDANAAKRLFRKALNNLSHPQPRVINTDLAPIYGSAITDIKKEETLRSSHRPVQYLNNIIEQDHRAIKWRVKAKQGFREFQAARRTIQGYDAVHIIRKGQVRWLSGSDRIGSSTNSWRWPSKILGNDSLLGELLFRSETCNTASQNVKKFVLTPVASRSSPIRGWLPLGGLPLESICLIPVPRILRVPCDGVSVVVIECFDSEIKIVVGKLKFHIVKPLTLLRLRFPASNPYRLGSGGCGFALGGGPSRTFAGVIGGRWGVYGRRCVPTWPTSTP